MSGQVNVFDTFVEDYDCACDRGLRLSGEHRDYFARRRVEYTRQLCSSPRQINTIVDFGCGLGHATPHFLDVFKRARIVGIDTAATVIEAATVQYGSPRAEFLCGGAGLALEADLIYTNGVFHHIDPRDRKSEAERLRGWLVDGGVLALWENNPWNPGTRLVMKRIPFDRDAQPLSYLAAERLLRSAGFQLLSVSFFFYFPSWLKSLRRWEPRLRRLPLGAQYCVIAQKTDRR